MNSQPESAPLIDNPDTAPPVRAARSWIYPLILAGVVACTAPVRPGPLHNIVRWSTASESDVFGYAVYRAEDRGGPFIRITTESIRGGGTTDIPTDYEFVDRGIEKGKIYYYFVESISLSGKRERFTPIMESKPKGL